MTPQNEAAFVPALIVVDMQEDFCPPVSLKCAGVSYLFSLTMTGARF